MKEIGKRLLAKSIRAIAAARRESVNGDAEFAVARAYYAMFYVAEALLDEKGLSFKKHGGVHAAFGEHFAKTGKLDPKYHRWLLAAFEKRITADYGVEEAITSEDATETITQAQEFLDAVQKLLDK